jgi:hypothetical protein
MPHQPNAWASLLAQPGGFKGFGTVCEVLKPRDQPIVEMTYGPTFNVELSTTPATAGSESPQDKDSIAKVSDNLDLSLHLLPALVESRIPSRDGVRAAEYRAFERRPQRHDLSILGEERRERFNVPSVDGIGRCLHRLHVLSRHPLRSISRRGMGRTEIEPLTLRL